MYTRTEGDRVRVLLVDDSATDRAIYRRLLGRDTSIDFEFLEASNGRDGLDLYEREAPDCTLLDYRLPDLDGLAFLSTLRERHGRAIQPIVVLTGLGDEATAVKALKLGAQDYLVKGDATRSMLGRAVRNAMTNHQLREEAASREGAFLRFTEQCALELREPIEQLRELAATGATAHPEALLEIASIVESRMNGLRDYAVAGRTDGRPAEVDLGPVLQQIVEDLEPRIERVGASVRWDDLCTVRGDEVQLTTLFRQLISNALGASDGEAPEIVVHAIAARSWWKIRVEDNGAGLDEATARDLFGGRSRVGPSPLSLGVATCRKIVDAMRGQIWIESRHGHGSTVHIWLRRAERDCQLAPAAAGATPTR